MLSTLFRYPGSSLVIYFYSTVEVNNLPQIIIGPHKITWSKCFIFEKIRSKTRSFIFPHLKCLSRDKMLYLATQNHPAYSFLAHRPWLQSQDKHFGYSRSEIKFLSQFLCILHRATEFGLHIVPCMIDVPICSEANGFVPNSSPLS